MNVGLEEWSHAAEGLWIENVLSQWGKSRVLKQVLLDL